MSVPTRGYAWRSWQLALALCMTACASSPAPAFDTRFPDNDGARTSAIVARLGRPAAASLASQPTLVATTHAAQPELVVYDLAAMRARFRVPLRAESRPELLGDLVLTTANQHLLGFDATNGTRRFSVSMGDCGYLGAARDDERVFFVCTSHSRNDRAKVHSRVTAIATSSGRTLWQREVKAALGHPAAINGLLLVPFSQQSLALLDPHDGRELARLRSRDDVIDWVRAGPDGVFFGQRTLYRLGRHGYSGRRQDASSIRVHSDQLPGQPKAIESAFVPQPGSRSAHGRIALYLEPEAVGEDGVRIARNRFYLVFYRYVFAYDAASSLRWARTLQDDVIAGQAVGNGLVVVSERGELRLLSEADGAPLLKADLGEPLAAASLSAAGLAVDATQHPTSGAALLRRSLAEIVLDTDNRLVPARAYALTELAKLEDPEVTADLLDIYAQASTPPELRRVVATALRSRRSGLQALVEALTSRYDFLEQSRPAPLELIVPALIEARERRAIPRLVQRMLDHETPLAVLPAVVRAVVTLGDDAVLEPLLSFLRVYRADSSFADQPQALIEAARGVLLHAREQGPSILASITEDGRANAGLVKGIAALKRATAVQQPSHRSEEPARGIASVTRGEEQRPALPPTLTQEAVNATFAAHFDDLHPCIVEELSRNPKLASVRIAFIAERDGSTHAFHFAPSTPQLAACLSRKLAACRFPAFRSGRGVASYVLAAQPPALEQAKAVAASAGEERFWDWYASAHSRQLPETRIEPWWQSQQWLVLQNGPAASAPEASKAQADGHAAATVSPPAPAIELGTAPATQNASPKAEVKSSAATEDAWWLPATPAKKPPAQVSDPTAPP